MIFKKNTLFTFFMIVAFLFLMALAAVTHNESNQENQTERQAELYQKTAAALTNIFSWAGSLTNLSLNRNIGRLQQVRGQAVMEEAVVGGWNLLNSDQSIDFNALNSESEMFNDEAWGSLGEDGAGVIAEGSQILKNMPNIKEISWGEVRQRLRQGWLNVQEIYQEFTIIY